MNIDHIQRLLDNSERRVTVLERICMQQEIELAKRDDTLSKRLEDWEYWRKLPKWKKILDVLKT